MHKLMGNLSPLSSACSGIFRLNDTVIACHISKGSRMYCEFRLDTVNGEHGFFPLLPNTCLGNFLIKYIMYRVQDIL